MDSWVYFFTSEKIDVILYCLIDMNSKNSMNSWIKSAVYITVTYMAGTSCGEDDDNQKNGL